MFVFWKCWVCDKRHTKNVGLVVAIVARFRYDSFVRNIQRIGEIMRTVKDQIEVLTHEILALVVQQEQARGAHGFWSKECQDVRLLILDLEHEIGLLEQMNEAGA